MPALPPHLATLPPVHHGPAPTHPGSPPPPPASHPTPPLQHTGTVAPGVSPKPRVSPVDAPPAQSHPTPPLQHGPAPGTFPVPRRANGRQETAAQPLRREMVGAPRALGGGVISSTPVRVPLVPPSPVHVGGKSTGFSPGRTGVLAPPSFVIPIPTPGAAPPVVTGIPWGASAAPIPVAAPAPPTIGLGDAHQIVGQQGTSGAASTFIAGTLASAAAGHPTAIANAEVLNLAQQLQIQGAYVGKYLGPQAAAAITKGLHMTVPPQLPRGTGKYDKDLPLILEQTVDAMIASNQDPTQLEHFAASLYQP
jgi:hypothetical protein